MKKIIQLGDPLLEKKSKPVKDINSPKVKKLAQDLIQVCKAKEENSGGLSAPQIGESLRIFVARRIDIEEEYHKKGKEIFSELQDSLWEVFINPVITKKGKKRSIEWEGCLSIDNGELFGPVERPSLIKIDYKDIDGNAKSIAATDYFSHIVQHEFDHLEGVLFVKYVSNPENLWKSKDLDKFMKEHGEFPPIE